jgi:hypothetical protein
MQSELAMLRAEVRALADNLKDAENRAGLQVSLCEQPLLAAQLVPLDIQPHLSHACHLPPNSFTPSMPHQQVPLQSCHSRCYGMLSLSGLADPMPHRTITESCI